jgi:hypothetical protein
MRKRLTAQTPWGCERGKDESTAQAVLGPSGIPTSLTWRVEDSDVNESATLQIFLATRDVKSHRFGTWDHRSYFNFRVRPPA